MKLIICLGDGMADQPIPALGNKTPLEAAHTPNMDWMAKHGQLGLVHTVPEGLSPGSDVANMGILGYDPRQYYTGRGPIEAASMKLSVPDGKIVFRCNLVCIEQGIMKDFTAGHIENEDGAALLAELNQELEGSGVVFFPGVSYRNLALLDEGFRSLTCVAPHDITDQSVAGYLPKGEGEGELLALWNRCHDSLVKSKINKRRIEQGKKPATHVWFWSQGPMPKLDPIQEKWNLNGGIVTAVDLLKGLAVLTGLEAPTVEGATGFLDTNYEGKVEAAFKLLEKGNFAYLHIEAPDESGHMGDHELKTQAISDFDLKVVGPVLAYQKANPDVRVLVLPDHPTPCRIKTHTSDPVPFVFYYNGIEKKQSGQYYSEQEADSTGLSFSFPWELLRYVLK